MHPYLFALLVAIWGAGIVVIGIVGAKYDNDPLMWAGLIWLIAPLFFGDRT